MDVHFLYLFFQYPITQIWSIDVSRCNDGDSRSSCPKNSNRRIYLHIWTTTRTSWKRRNVRLHSSALINYNCFNTYRSWRLVPKQDHLTCFLAGSLMLGAVTTNPRVPRNRISRPPSPDQLSEHGLRDWKSGSELLKTCLHTHDTATWVPLFCLWRLLRVYVVKWWGLIFSLANLGVFRLRSFISEFRVMVWMRCRMHRRIGISRVPSEFCSSESTYWWSIEFRIRLGEPAPYSARYMLR